MSSRFQAVEWSHDTNIYEVNIRQYTADGTFRAFSKELPRLKDMGVETLWFMPITPISFEKRLGSLGSYYACSDYLAVNPEFGTLDDFKILVQEAHQLGFKVIIDWVANHTGWDHRWTREHPDFYKRNAQGDYYDAHGWEDVIDLNYENRAMRQAMIDAMRFWVLELGIDGFRCDMAMLVPQDFWLEARTTLDQTRKLFWFAECEEIEYHEVFDASYAWRFLHRMEAYWRKECGLAGLEQDLEYYQEQFPPTALQAFFTTNHDENSHSGSEYERMGDAALAFAVLCCTWGGVPLIYSGQELPNRKRLKFFDKDQIEWTGKYELHDFFKTLLHLRKRNGALRAGDPSVKRQRIGTEENIFAYVRSREQDQVMVLLNLSATEQSVWVPEFPDPVCFQDCFTGQHFCPGQQIPLKIGPWEFRVFEKVNG